MRSTAVLIALVVGACRESPSPNLTCGATCNSSIQCQGDILQRCKYCNFGTCKSTRPESLILDAGVDAAPQPERNLVP